MRVIISDVTYLSKEICVAGWCPAERRMVRPLSGIHRHWPTNRAGSQLFAMGNVIEFTPAGILNTRGLPHSREDLIVLPDCEIVETIPDEEIADALAESESRCMEDLFGGHLQDNRLVMSGADCHSLGATRVGRDTIWFFEKVWDDERKLRCTFQDEAGQLFNFPVPSVALRDRWHEGGVAALNELFRGGGDAHLRIGLAHPMDDGRAFAMINGIANY